jgi:hypothetical protein
MHLGVHMQLRTNVVLALLVGALGGGCASGPTDLPGEDGGPVSVSMEGHAMGHMDSMGAPLPVEPSDLLDARTSIVEGRRTSAEDVPVECVSRAIALDSDPNFEGAHDMDYVEYTRTYQIEVVKFVLISKHHTPDILPRDLARFSCTDTVYERMHYSIPSADRTPAMCQAAYEKSTAAHARRMSRLSARACDGKTRLYLVHYLAAGASALPGEEAQTGLSFLEGDDHFSMKDVEAAMKGYPEGTFIRP